MHTQKKKEKNIIKREKNNKNDNKIKETKNKDDNDNIIFKIILHFKLFILLKYFSFAYRGKASWLTYNYNYKIIVAILS